MRDRATTADTQLERTLRSLAAAEPSPGFEERLKAAIPAAHGRAEARHAGRRGAYEQTGKWGVPLAFTALPAFAVSLCAAILAVIAFSGVHRHREGTPGGAAFQQAKPNPKLAGSSSRTLTAAGVPVTPASRINEGSMPSAEGAGVPVVRADFRLEVARTAATRKETEAGRLDRQAADDLRAPSQPAPALPLTAQERSVALMLRHGERHDLAQLDPTDVLRVAEHDAAALHAFFEPPPPAFVQEQSPVPGQPAPQKTTTTAPPAAPDTPATGSPLSTGDPQ